MNGLSTFLKVLSLVGLICNVGCSATPNLLTVSKNGIVAHGHISHNEEKIDDIDIYPAKLSADERRNLIIGFSTQGQVPLLAITEELIKQIAIPSTRYYANPAKPDYFIDGYDFAFNDGKLVKLSVNVYGWPPKNKTAFVSISSSDGASLTLPCSVNDFEKIFGKVKIGRAYYE